MLPADLPGLDAYHGAQLVDNQRQPIGRVERPRTVLVINRGDIQECAFFDLVGFSAYSNA